MSISVNLVSGKPAVALGVAVVALAIGGVLGATYLIRRRLEATSTLRHSLSLVLLTVASPLILLSVLGTWGGYLMFLAAVLVAVAVSSRRGDARGAFVTLGGMALIAAGPATIATELRDLASDPFLRAYAMIGGLMEIAGGAALLMRSERSHKLIDEDMARKFLSIGIITAVCCIVGLGTAIFSPTAAAIVLPLIGLVIADIGYCLVVLMTPQRVDRITARWHELTRPRGPNEQNPPYGQAVMHFLKRYGTVTPLGAHPRPVDPEPDSPAAALRTRTAPGPAGPGPSPTPKQSP